MYANIQLLVFLVLASQHNSFGFYVRDTEETPLRNGDTTNNRNNDWEVLQNKLGLSQEKVELLKAQKDQQGTKELLNRFILENPKYLSTVRNNKVKQQNLQFKRLLRVLVTNLRSSKSMLKTTFHFELSDRSLKPKKRGRRKIAVKMESDMSSKHIDHFLKMFYQEHNIQPSEYNINKSDQQNDDGDYSDSDIPRRASVDTDSDSYYEYDNLYDDEGDVALTAQSRQNSEYGSFQDLILQAKRNQWESENEETKLHNSSNDHFI